MVALRHGPALPKWVQTSAFGLAPYQFLRHCQRRYGDVLRLRLSGMGDLHLFSEPRAVQQIFALPSTGMSNGNDPVRYLLDPRSVVFLEGDAHRLARQALTPPFAGRTLEAYSPRFTEAARQVSDRWSEGESVDLTAAFQEMTFDSLLEVTLGVTAENCPGALRTELLRFVSGQLSSAMFFASSVFGPRLYEYLRGRANSAKTAVDQGLAPSTVGPLTDRANNLARVEICLESLVRERRRAGVHGSDALSRMLATNGFSDLDVVHQLLTLLIAGHDTTSLSLSWTMAQLLARPAVLARVLDEAGSLGDDLGQAGAPALPYTRAVVNESLRFTPVASFVPRRLDRDLEIGGITVPAGACIAANVVGAHCRDASWVDPDVFRPERFLERDPIAGTFFPFGGGLRRCLGAAFATTEMTLVLATLLQRWRFTPPSHEPAWATMHGFLIGPAVHLRATLNRKKS